MLAGRYRVGVLDNSSTSTFPWYGGEDQRVRGDWGGRVIYFSCFHACLFLFRKSRTNIVPLWIRKPTRTARWHPTLCGQPSSIVRQAHFTFDIAHLMPMSLFALGLVVTTISADIRLSCCLNPTQDNGSTTRPVLPTQQQRVGAQSSVLSSER